MKITIKNILPGSTDYWKSVVLREAILRKPLGLTFTKKELLSENKQLHFLCFQEKEIIGCFILIKNNSNTLKMRQVCIKSKFQQKGIGSKMLLFAEKWAKENGFNQIYCHARNNALAFYKKLNYHIEGNSIVEVGLKHYKMVKNI